MYNRKMLLIGIISASICQIYAMAEISGSGSMIQCKLELGKQRFIEGESVALYITMTNTSEETQRVPRPEGEDLTLAVQGPGTDGCVLQLNKRVVSVSDREIALRPRCAIRIALGSVLLMGDEETPVPLPLGTYLISGSWKSDSLPPRQGFREIKDCAGDLIEYPFRVSLIPVSSTVYSGDPVIIAVEMVNEGRVPLSFLNYFHPYEHNFELSVERENIGDEFLEGKAMKSIPSEIPKVTPSGSGGWITLLPNESLFINIDIGKDMPVPGKYNVSIAYARHLLLLAPKPRNTKQYQWYSDTVEITTVPKKKEDGLK